MSDKIKIGVVGNGGISGEHLGAYAKNPDVEIWALCDINEERLNRRGDQFNVDPSRRFTDVNEMLKACPEIDAVSVCTWNSAHAPCTIAALNAGKHVLCEKPMAFTVQESEELYDLAEKQGVVLLEGIRTAYLPGFQQLLNVAHSGVIGKIVDVEAAFTRLADPKSREMNDAMYGGAFLEFGSYTLLPIFKLLGLSFNDIRIDSIIDEKTGIDRYTKVRLKYDHAMATSKTGAGVKSEGQLVVSGTKGYILAQSPWWLTSSFDVRYEDAGKVDHYESSFKGDGYRYEINEFITKINGTGGITYKLTPEESIAMAEVVEKFMGTRKK